MIKFNDNQAQLPLGFKASGVCANIKRKDKLDLALFYSEKKAKAACLFTTNTLPAAPIILCREYLRRVKFFYAIIANSGNANCFTSKAGLKDSLDMSKVISELLGVHKEAVLVASTGVIGKRLPIEKIIAAAPVLVKSLAKDGIKLAKKAILTTDTLSKACTVKFKLDGKLITICGIAKGSGMIAPNMATMFSFIFTDAEIESKVLNSALKKAVGVSFNCITVDACMSTNDMVAVLANGEAKNKIISNKHGLRLFEDALNLVCLDLAKKIVKDAEGATKFITITVGEAKDYSQAKKAALAVANSNLFKTAVYGQNPNFGRIVASVGSCGIDLKEEEIKIKVSSLRKKEINVLVLLGKGKSSATVYTSDLTPEYIKINAAYN